MFYLILTTCFLGAQLGTYGQVVIPEPFASAGADYGDGRQCSRAAILRELFDTGALKCFTEVSAPESNTDGLGNCHEAAMALMTDLIVAGKASGWVWADGRTL